MRRRIRKALRNGLASGLAYEPKIGAMTGIVRLVAMKAIQALNEQISHA